MHEGKPIHACEREAIMPFDKYYAWPEFNLGTDDKPIYIRDYQPDQLTVDHRYQRALRRDVVDYYKRTFDPEAFGFLHVSIQPDEAIHIIDGQNRNQVALELGHGWVPTLTHLSLTQAEEAALFVKLNPDSQPRAPDLFKAQLVAGDPVAHGVQGILDQTNFTILPPHVSQYLRPHQIGAVKTLQIIYIKCGAGVLETVLKTINAIWPEDRYAVAAYFIRGLAQFAAIYSARKDFDSKHYLKVLKGTTPYNVVHSAFRFEGERRRGQGIALALLDLYNAGVDTGKRLPDLIEPFAKLRRERVDDARVFQKISQMLAV